MSEAVPEVPAEPAPAPDPVSALDPDPAPVATEVVATVPSSTPDTQPEAAPVVVEPASVEEAATVLLAFVDEGRKPGDRDLDAARELLRSALGA